MRSTTLLLAGLVVVSPLTEETNQPPSHPLILTRLRPILLRESPTRADHRSFAVQVFRGVEKLVELQKEDRLLTVQDLRAVSSGPATLVVQSICADGEKSTEIAYNITIQHEKPIPPGVEQVVLTEEEAKAATFEDLMFIRRRERALTAEVPAPAGAVVPVPASPPPPPLPNSTNRAYQAHLRRSE